MVRFLGVASLLLFSYSALVAADIMKPRVPIAATNDIGHARLWMRADSDACQGEL